MAAADALGDDNSEVLCVSVKAEPPAHASAMVAASSGSDPSAAALSGVLTTFSNKLATRARGGAASSINDATPPKQVGDVSLGTPEGFVNLGGKPLCALAKRVPALKKTGDLAGDNKKASERDCLIKLLQFLNYNPGASATIWNSVQAGSIFEQKSVKRRTRGDDVSWPDCYMHMASCPSTGWPATCAT